MNAYISIAITFYHYQPQPSNPILKHPLLGGILAGILLKKSKIFIISTIVMKQYFYGKKILKPSFEVTIIFPHLFLKKKQLTL